MFIYKNYDKEALDRQYNNRIQVPDFAQTVQQWEQRSERLRQRVQVDQDVPYGPHEREKMDIFPPRRSGRPLQVFFHGGYWQSMDKRVFDFIAAGFIENEIVTVVVNYPLAPQATMDEIVNSCRQVVAWLYRYAAEYNGDPNSIYVSGHSAGGQIVAMLMATRWSELAGDLPDDLIKGGCAISGLFDLTPIQLSYVNDKIGLDQAAAQRNSPILLSPVCRCPLIVAVGRLETDEFRAQSHDFAVGWSQQGIALTELTIAGANHFSILDQLTTPEAPLNRAILAQMEQR